MPLPMTLRRDAGGGGLPELYVYSPERPSRGLRGMSSTRHQRDHRGFHRVTLLGLAPDTVRFF